MLWLVAGAAFFLRYILSKTKRMPWFIPPSLLLVGICALAWAQIPFIGGSLASWIGTIPGWLCGLLAGLINVPTSVVVTLVMIGLIIAAAKDLLDKQADKWAKTAFLLLPFLAVSAVGPIAEAVTHITQTVGSTGVTVISHVAGA